MRNADTTGVVIYWNPDQPFVIHRAYHVCFDEYNYWFLNEYKNAPGSLLHKQDTETHVHNSDLLNWIPSEIGLTYTPFCDTKTLTYEIELPPSENKVGFNLLDDEDITIPCINNTIQTLPAGHQLPTQSKLNVWIIDIN